MSTVYTNITGKRIAILAKMNEEIFHIHDLALLWRIKDKNLVHTTLKRYCKYGIINRIYKGFYSLKKTIDLDPYLLGIKAIHNYAYISTETILVKEGIISQIIPKITLISSKSTKFQIGSNNYASRQLKDIFLYNSTGIEEKNGIQIATKERAIADLLYFNPRAYLDTRDLINWKKVKSIQKEIGYTSNL